MTKIAASNPSQINTFYNSDLKMVKFKDFGQTGTNDSRNTPNLRNAEFGEVKMQMINDHNQERGTAMSRHKNYKILADFAYQNESTQGFNKRNFSFHSEQRRLSKLGKLYSTLCLKSIIRKSRFSVSWI